MMGVPRHAGLHAPIPIKPRGIIARDMVTKMVFLPGLLHEASLVDSQSALCVCAGQLCLTRLENMCLCGPGVCDWPPD